MHGSTDGYEVIAVAFSGEPGFLTIFPSPGGRRSRPYGCRLLSPSRTFACNSLASDAQSLHHAHHRHRIPQIATAGCRNVAVGQLLRNVAIWHLPHILQDRRQDRVMSRGCSVFILPTLGLPSCTPRPLAARSATLVRSEIIARSFSAKAA
jgi:hypothetical protein